MPSLPILACLFLPLFFFSRGFSIRTCFFSFWGSPGVFLQRDLEHAVGKLFVIGIDGQEPVPSSVSPTSAALLPTFLSYPLKNKTLPAPLLFPTSPAGFALETKKLTFRDTIDTPLFAPVLPVTSSFYVASWHCLSILVILSTALPCSSPLE